MGEGLLSKEMKSSLEEIVSHCFYCNRILDRIVSILDVKFVMKNTANLIHIDFAHRYPLIADKVTEYMSSRDCTSIYGATPIGNQDYSNYIDCINTILEVQLKLEDKVKESIELSNNIKDYTTKVFLDNFLYEISGITSDILLIVDKSEMYGNSQMSAMKFDDDIKGFFE